MDCDEGKLGGPRDRILTVADARKHSVGLGQLVSAEVGRNVERIVGEMSFAKRRYC